MLIIRVLFIVFNLLEATALACYISTIRRYKSIFKEKADPITVAVMVCMAVGMFSKVAVRLPTELFLLYGDIMNES